MHVVVKRYGLICATIAALVLFILVGGVTCKVKEEELDDCQYL